MQRGGGDAGGDPRTAWQAVDVSPDEEAVYEALAWRRDCTADELAGEVDLSRSRLTRALHRLAERGLVTRSAARPARYTALPPEQVAAALIAERERDLLRLRAHAHQLGEQLRQQHRTGRAPSEVLEVVEGAANVQATFTRLQREARVQIRGFDRPPYLEDPIGGNPEESRQLSDHRLTYRVVYHPSALSIPGRIADLRQSIQHGEQARVSPQVPMKLVLCDDRFALIPVVAGGHRPDSAYLVHPSSLLAAFGEMFEAVWARAVAVNAASQPGAGTLSDRETDLIGLLASGATDETIARVLGWSVRTVHRHVHRIMSSVGAETRFQAGMEAVRRGWV